MVNEKEKQGVSAHAPTGGYASRAAIPAMTLARKRASTARAVRRTYVHAQRVNVTVVTLQNAHSGA